MRSAVQMNALKYAVGTFVWAMMAFGAVHAMAQNGGDALKMPEVPTFIVKPEERLAYFVRHYWDHFDFGDTTLIHRTEYAEQAFVDYLSIINNVELEQQTASIKGLLDCANGNGTMYRYFITQFEHYLYHPESPMQDEERYITVLEHLLKSPWLKEAEKERPKFQLQLALKNRIGQVAADFSFTTRQGKKGRLQGLSLRSPLLLIFMDPHCKECQSLVSTLGVNEALKSKVEKGQMTVLAVDTDQDRPLWENIKNDLPSGWMAAIDESDIGGKELYDLKRMPTVYVLDKQKRVIKKNLSLEGILEVINMQTE